MRDERGFVLLDRTVVAAVGVVVAVVLIIASRGADDQASAAACRQDATQVANAVDAYRALHSGTVPAQRNLVEARLLPHVSAMHRIVPEPDSEGYRIVPTGRCARD
jgi:hypothetical protein